MSRYTPPPMSDELMYQIIFCMEDQANTYLFDMAEGGPVQRELARQGDRTPRVEQAGSGDLERQNEMEPGSGEVSRQRYRELPSWTPADGFRIMEKFVSSLKNPIFREKLREALSQGRGVFRSFKNVLKEEPAVERLWYYFKEREIKRIIYVWYEQLTEIAWLEAIGEPELDTADLILSDFSVTDGCTRWGAYIRQVGERRLDTEFAGIEYPLNELLVDEYRRRWADFHEGWLMVCVEAPSGEAEVDGNCVGFIGAEPVETESGGLMYRVQLLYVEPRYRGLGIFKLLIDALTERAADSGADRLVIELSGKAAVTAPALEHRGFMPFSERLSLDLQRVRQERELERGT